MTLMAEVRATPAMVHPKPIRVLLYSHDSLGLGHVRRNLALAHALSAQLPDVTGRPVTGLLLTSLDGLADQLPDDFDILALPGVTKRDGAYYPRGMSVSRARLKRMRASLLTAAVLEFEPDLPHDVECEHPCRLTSSNPRQPRPLPAGPAMSSRSIRGFRRPSSSPRSWPANAPANGSPSMPAGRPPMPASSPGSCRPRSPTCLDRTRPAWCTRRSSRRNGRSPEHSRRGRR